MSSPKAAPAREHRWYVVRVHDRPTCSLAADGFEGWAALADAWQELEGQGRPAFFVTFEWLDAYWRTQGSRHRPYVLAVHDEAGTLVGFAPFETVARRAVRTLGPPIIALRFPCRREREGVEFLAREGSERAVADAVARQLRRSRSGWHELVLTDAALDGPILRALRREFGADPRYRVGVMPRPPTPIVHLSGTWEEYLAGLSSQARRGVRRAWRRLADRDGRLRVLEDPGEVRRALAFLFEMKNARLREVADGSVYERAAVRDFLCRAADGMVPKRRLVCTVVEFAGALAAVDVSFRVGDRMWDFVNAFDPGWGSLGLGLRLLEHSIQLGLSSGATTLVLGQGAADFKARHASQLQTNVDLRIERRWVAAATAFGRLLQRIRRQLPQPRSHA
jgi:CelD/BcsL family acetyltransferase involved in cellulose biosynthesis